MESKVSFGHGETLEVKETAFEVQLAAFGQGQAVLRGHLPGKPEDRASDERVLDKRGTKSSKM